jgi:penicillin-binding protein 1C
MQAVRLIAPHPKSLWWKWKEAVMALKMERSRSKEWIISQYLNRAPFGANFVGVEAAAQGWFGKGAKDLGLGEAALLAGMVQAPSRYRPDRHYDRAIKRRDYVLGRMVALGMITEEQRKGAQSVKPVLCRAPRPFKAPYFCDWAMQYYGAERGGDVTTTLNADVQERCEHAVNAAAEAGGYSVAAVVMKAETGAVLALACSGDYFDQANGQVNTALAPRPAGSTLKPFLTALAIERGVVAPDERLCDVPVAFKGYRPANFDAKYRGLVPVRDALVLSLNIPFVQMLQRVGVPSFGDCLRGLGLRHVSGGDEQFGLGMAIGNVEVSLMELASAYAVLARGGGEVFSPGTCYLVSDMLSGTERAQAALGHVADVETSRFSWKTGTSSAYRDAWTVVWNPEYVVGVWCGHKSGGFGDRTLVGAKAAAPVAWGIARALYPQNTGPWFVEPGEVVRRKVCALTGLPANADCPETEEGRAIEGRSATALCPVHCRDFNGNVVERRDAFLKAFSGRMAQAEKLAIAKPENEAVFTLVSNAVKQKIVCQAVGNPDGARLWWFVDGACVGESVGSAPFAADMVVGVHELSCSTAEGVSASVLVTVKDER